MKKKNISETESFLSKKGLYYNLIRWDLVELIEGSDNKVLEIGCSTGNTGSMLKEKGMASEVVGIEMSPEIAEIAKTKLDKVITGNIENLNLPFGKNYFDYILVGDVLEHLNNPWETLRNLNYFLENEGYIISSIPNIRNWTIIKNLIVRGEWKYSNAGILDRTHLRFFTKKSIIELFENSGFPEMEVTSNCRIKSRMSKYNLINTFTFGLFEGFLTYQYIIKAKKK